MDVRIATWQISTLINKLDIINDQPEYQRGKVWSKRKNALLIDSILRGIDMPKIYLRELERNPYDFEVADGQQRLNAISKFKNNQFSLLEDTEKGLDLSEINGFDIGGKTFKMLQKELRESFDNYPITVAIISDSDGSEIRTLFGRLQEGETLNPAEKRNAIISPIRDYVDTVARYHPFFENSRISSRRYKRQDYAAHALTLVAYENDSDLKANLILKLYLDQDFKITQTLMSQMSDIFDVMKEIDEKSSNRIYKKYNFIDIFWHLYRNLNKIDSFAVNRYSEKYDELEEKRLKYHHEPKNILTTKGKIKNRDHFYNYVDAFRHGGSLTENIKKRSKYFDIYFKKIIQ